MPDRMPSRPDVDAPSDGLDPASDALVVAPVLVASPRIDTAFAPIVIGASSETRACVPDRSPSSPVVSTACATVAPRSVMPPARSVPQRARETMVFMISP